MSVCRRKRILFQISIILLSVLAVLHTGLSQANAQAADDGTLRNLFRSSSAAVLALTTDDHVSGGHYKFKSDKPDAPDADADIIKAYIEIPLSSSEADFIPLLEISPAYFKLEQESQELGFTAELESFGIGGGVGVQLKFFEKLLEITPKFRLEYSELEYGFSLSENASTANFF